MFKKILNIFRPNQHPPLNTVDTMMDQTDKTSTSRVQELLASGKPQEALALCQHRCQASDARPEDWLLYGRLSADSGDRATARMALEKATALAPDSGDAWFALGKLLAADDPKSAVAHLEKAAELQPDNADIWLTLGITCGLARQMAKAEQYCRRSLLLQPESAQARFYLGNVLQAQKKFSEAETEYEAALQIEPELAAAWNMLAQARVGLGKFHDAEAAAIRTLRLDPRMGQAHFTLGIVSNELGETVRARDHFRKATELMPKMLDAHWRLGQTLMALKEFSEAEKSFQAILNINPRLFKPHVALGDIFYQQALYDKAGSCYRKAIELGNNEFEVHLYLAFAYQKMNRNDKYEKQLVECLRLYPDDAHVQHLLAIVRGENPSTAPAVYVREIFDGYAENFDAHLVGALNYHTPEDLYELVKERVAAAASSLDVIDLGCGTGLCAPLFRAMARTLHGVDIAPKMIEKAQQRALYDKLDVDDIVTVLKSKTAAWDLAISTDVFIYVGALEAVFAACATALRPGGFLAFSIEAGDDSETFVLRKSGRYAHATGYIRTLAATTGFDEIECRDVVLRNEGQGDMNGYIFLLRRTAEAPH